MQSYNNATFTAIWINSKLCFLRKLSLWHWICVDSLEFGKNARSFCSQSVKRASLQKPECFYRHKDGTLKMENQTPKLKSRPPFSRPSAPWSQWDRLVPVYTTGTKRSKLTKAAIFPQHKWNCNSCQARAVHWALMIKGDRRRWDWNAASRALFWVNLATGPQTVTSRSHPLERLRWSQWLWQRMKGKSSSQTRTAQGFLRTREKRKQSALGRWRWWFSSSTGNQGDVFQLIPLRFCSHGF